MSIRGMEQLSDILELIRKPEKFATKIAELQDATAKYEQAVGAYTQIQEIKPYLMSIEAKVDQATTTLAKAQEKATEIVASAEKQAAELQSVVNQQKEQNDILGQQNQNIAADLKQQEKELIAREKACATLSSSLEQRLAACQKLESDLSERKSRLLAAIG